MKKSDREDINPFTGKKHFNILNDDKFLEGSYAEYNNLIDQSKLLDDSESGKLVSNVSLNLIGAVEKYLLEINRTDYTKNYYDWEFHLVSDDTVNALCMPGGKIIVYSGILSIANIEETLAFILAHEMAHALLDHGRTKVSAYTAKNTITTASRLGAIGLGLVGLGDVADVARTTINVADVGSEYLLMKPWGRDQEMEADNLGMKIINWAGYDIKGIPEFWQRMSEHSSNKYDFFSTHPSDNKRIDAMNKLVSEMVDQQYSNDVGVLFEKSDKEKCKGALNLSEISNQQYSNNVPVSSVMYNQQAIENKTSKQQEIIKKEPSLKKYSKNFCGKCGNPLKEDYKFCIKCGNKIN
jgi:predicted Zn-dependent protease